MKLEDKKFLAEWMGWNIIKKDVCFNTDEKLFILKKTKYGTSEIPTSHYNPSDDLYEFREIWNKLSDRQKYEVEYDLEELYGEEEDNPFTFLLNELPKVMDAVIKVLKEIK